ncbi:MAG TPA: FIST N-terminal domain-containing protein [Anaerolineae bacterium]|nr:FIST N-terminal domain-containing protein [Anaerolineae bacterium]
MNITQHFWQQTTGWNTSLPTTTSPAQLLLIFGSPANLQRTDLITQLQQIYPQAHLFGCSTSGEIYTDYVYDGSLVATAIHFEHAYIHTAATTIQSMENSFTIGQQLSAALPPDNLRHLLVLSDGLHVNGSELVRGLAHNLPDHITMTGGLSGDADRFTNTYVLHNGQAQQRVISVVGLYGQHLHIGYGSMGGWDAFGPERLITRSDGNILYELNGQSALALYKKYLGQYASGLPSTGLLFPLSLRTETNDDGLVRTILAINEEDQSLTFAGDVPEGTYARLMKANFERLVDGAIGAAQTSYQALNGSSPELALLISCVGRKLVLKQRVDDEIEGVRSILGPQPIFTGFYSYGEISPFNPSAKCQLHNQTMTITTLSEQTPA